MRPRVVALLASAALLAGCHTPPAGLADLGRDFFSDGTSPDGASDGAGDTSLPTALYLQVDPTLPSWVAPRLKALLAGATSLPVKEVKASETPTGLGPGAVILSIGSTTTTDRLCAVLDLLGNPSTAAKASLADAQKALDDAAKVVTTREKSYRVPAERIAGWRDNPTAYPFTYLWTARSLHYWWRDEGKAIKAPVSPCYLNIMDPAKIAFGEGLWVAAAPYIQQVLKALGLGSLVGACLTGPSAEPTYPPAGLRP